MNYLTWSSTFLDVTGSFLESRLDIVIEDFSYSLTLHSLK